MGVVFRQVLQKPVNYVAEECLSVECVEYLEFLRALIAAASDSSQNLGQWVLNDATFSGELGTGLSKHG